ncbi:MAG: transcriptional regulator [Alphaproteobacteria bacterium]|nr:transcriptional regulator [Alphaproteobacteria bacterium]
MTTLKVGIASYEQMKARTMSIARGDLVLGVNEPKVWFTSLESFAKVMSERNQELLNIIAKELPNSLTELEALSGRKKANLSRTLNRMAVYGLVELLRGERGRIAPRVKFDRLELELPLLQNGRKEPGATQNAANGP